MGLAAFVDRVDWWRDGSGWPRRCWLQPAIATVLPLDASTTLPGNGTFSIHRVESRWISKAKWIEASHIRNGLQS